MRRSLLASCLVGSVLVSACGGGTPAKDAKASDKTFAGQNRCNEKNADRPFIIEWDATDQSSFQSHAANDVVFVSYHGCEMKVLDGCRDDSVRGSAGSYAPVVFTSGGVETIDIHDQSELYAKLPLGAATLGGRVEKGEKFHMEYYVSGTRTATRDKLFKGELAKNPKCASATHFVYAYNLGAFALASKSSLKGEVSGSYFGFGAGGKKEQTSSAEKKGGELAACKGDSATEVETCKVPIRLTLRELSEGANPDKSAAKAPETDAALNLAGKLQATTDKEKAAAGHLDSANVKKASKDGKGCLAELDQHDTLDPRQLSTNPASGKIAGLRGECLMLAGQCDAGKAHFRKAVQATKADEVGPDRLDKIVEAEGSLYCTGDNLNPRDQFLRAQQTLTQGAFVQKKTVAECQAALDTIIKLRTTVKRKDADDAIPEKPMTSIAVPALQCFAKAGDCAAAYKAHKQMNDIREDFKPKDEKQSRAMFDGWVPTCKGK